MANVGLSKPYYAAYTNSGSGTTYSNGAKIAKAISCKIENGGGEAENWYADNGIAESSNSFGNGTLTLETDSLPLAVAKDLFDLTVDTSSVYHFNADDVPPYLGFGIIKKLITGGATAYWGIVLPKIQFQVPNEDLTTQGESVEFASNEITATIMRDDTTGDWKLIKAFDSESDAENWIKTTLGISTTST